LRGAKKQRSHIWSIRARPQASCPADVYTVPCRDVHLALTAPLASPIRICYLPGCAPLRRREFIDTAEAMRLVDELYSKGKPAIDAARKLIATAAVCWQINEGMYRDDITAIVIYLRPALAVLANEAVAVGGSARKIAGRLRAGTM
jgi:hypothetical protein